MKIKNNPKLLVLSYILAVTLLLHILMLLSGCGTRKSTINKTLDVAKIRNNLFVKNDFESIVKSDTKINNVKQADFKSEWGDETIKETFEPSKENNWIKSRETTKHRGSITDKGNEQTQTQSNEVSSFADHSQINDNYDSLSRKKDNKKTTESDKTVVANVGGKWMLIGIIIIIIGACFVYFKRN